MSRKRGANGKFISGGGSVTGGTGDIKPQWLTQVTPIPAGVDDYSVVEIIVPRLVLGQRDMATIMEVLRVDWYIDIRDFADTTSTAFAFLNTRLTRATNDAASVGSFLADLSDPTSFAAAYHSTVVATTGTAITTMPLSVDMTDQNGNGTLIAAERIFMYTGSVGNTTAQEGVVKILYRMVNVGLSEYVGIVASQSHA